MSSYINFYLVNEKTNQYISVDNFSRSNTVYQVADEHYAPYNKGTKLKSMYECMMEDMDTDIVRYKESILDYETKIKIVATMTGDLSERLETINDYQTYISDLKEEIEDLKYWRQWFRFLMELDAQNEDWSIWYGIEWYPKYKNEENDDDDIMEI